MRVLHNIYLQALCTIAKSSMFHPTLFLLTVRERTAVGDVYLLATVKRLRRRVRASTPATAYSTQRAVPRTLSAAVSAGGLPSFATCAHAAASTRDAP